VLGPDIATARQAGELSVPAQRLSSLAGVYRRETGDITRVELRDSKLWLADGGPVELVPLSASHFTVRGFDADVQFDSASDGSRSLRMRRGSAHSQLYRRMAPFMPTVAQLAAFAGRYRSSELDTELRLVAGDSTLVLEERRPGSSTLRPIYTDAFRGGIGVMEFSRDANGRVTGFVVNAGRVRGLRFDRIE
jgi:hypothetical protein